jgi:hypothetical protein
MQYTAKDWDDVRMAFATSIMVDTSLNSLAQNLDGPEWPIQTKDETPAKYIDLNYEEVLEILQLKGQTPERVDQLIGILRATLEFDNPFGDMVEQTQAAEARDNAVLKNLTKLAIPENFPIELTSLEPSTLEFCKLENLSTLGEFAVFAQGMSQTVIVGGDFRKLLNALSHVDEDALAEALPFRRGHKGLHLVEAVAHAARKEDGAGRVELATTWFRNELAALEKDLAAGGSLERYFVTLGNPELEKRAADLLRPHLRIQAAAAKPPEPEKKRAGLFSWFSRRK